MRLIRRWPKLRRRVVVARRCYGKAYWYCWEFKEEFVNEICGPREVDENDPHKNLPLYYYAYLFIRRLPSGLKMYIEGIQSDYAKWVAFRDNTQLGFKNISNEIREIHSDNMSNYKLWISVAIRLFRDSLNQFLKGYNEAMSGKPFPSEEKVEEKSEGKTNPPSEEEKERKE